MCLAIPARIIKIEDADYAVVDINGVQQTVAITLIDNPQIDDYVIVHVGFALNKIDPDEAEKTLALFASLAATEAPASFTAQQS